MSLSRRSLLKAFAAAPLSLTAIKERVLNATGVHTASIAGYSRSLEVTQPELTSSAYSVFPGLSLVTRTLEPWAKARLKKQAHNVRFLDADIAALRSISAAGAIALQRQRQYNLIDSASWWERLEKDALLAQAEQLYYNRQRDASPEVPNAI